MERDDLLLELEAIAPASLAEEMDNGRIGLIVEGREEVGHVACALDATPLVVARAAASGAGMLVVHHTPLWHPLTAITGSNARLLREILQSRMNIFVMHTNFDRAPHGVNDTLSEMLGLERVEALSLGLVGDCLLGPTGIARILGAPLRVWGTCPDRPRLAVVGGAGFDPLLMEEASSLGAVAFLSSELKHSTMRSTRLACLESTHYALEAPAMRSLAARTGWEYIDDQPLLDVL